MYSLDSLSPGIVTEAVQPSGIENSHIHLSPSYLHELFIVPETEL